MRHLSRPRDTSRNTWHGPLRGTFLVRLSPRVFLGFHPLLLVLVFLLGCGRTREEGRELSLQADSTEPPTFSYLALGDSYTIGEGVDSAGRWPVRLAEELRKEGVPLEDPVIVARTGWTTDELAAGIDSTNLHPPYDLVSLLIGVNNQYRGRGVDEFREEFRDLLSRAAGFAGGDPGRVLVLSIPDWGVTPFAEEGKAEEIGRAIDAFNEVVRDETREVGARFVDVTGVSRRLERDPEAVTTDGLHPSETQYARWVDVALPVVRAIFGPGEGEGRPRG
jgi:lysophospholipase L1-like esterase